MRALAALEEVLHQQIREELLAEAKSAAERASATERELMVMTKAV